MNFEQLFEIIEKLSERERAVIAIDGGSGSGKTTLADRLCEKYGCTVFHMDDFFLQKHQRTPERYAEVGGNIDRERFIEEVLTPLKEKKEVTYRKFDCKTLTLSQPICVNPKKMVVIEGVYSMHLAFEEYYDFSVFLDIDNDMQRKRIESRNTKEMAERYFNEWLPLENAYFEKMSVKNRCDMTVEIKE